jgi:enoyl-CoA hydratase/carnithine racemase
MNDGLRIDRRGPVIVLVLDRPERSNALSRATVQALGRAGRELERDATVRAVVITGSGDRAFCAGADLKERLHMADAEVLELLGLYRSELRWLGGLRVPVIAAINGVALGGGLELALACDFRVARVSAILGLPETSLGIIPGAGGTQRLPRIVGEAKAKELILLGARLTAPEALESGLLHRVFPDEDDFMARTLEFIRPVIEGAPIAQAAALRAIRAASLPLEDGLKIELDAYEECLASEDRREALEAFREKRPPRFRGR